MISRTPEWLRLTVVAFVALILFGLGGVVIWAALIPIPAINNFENRQVAQSTKIYDRTGNTVLYDVHGTVRRTVVPLDEIAPNVRNATVAIEDASFYTNAGFRPLAFMRAVWVDFRSGSYKEGGSTITQQVVKNALLTPNKTIARKLEEIILAMRLTKKYSKDQILNTYLNESPYGGTIYGVQEASQYFFGVDAKNLDLAQSAYLAAIPQAPTYYSPYGSNRKALDARKNLVLQRMKDNNFITKAEYDSAVKEKVQFKSETTSGIKAPHFVFYIQQYLEDKYGVDMVNSGGLRVITTLDYDLQQKAEASVAKYADQMHKDFNASNEGMVAIEPASGQILAMIGSRDYFNDEVQGKVNVTLAQRQPGSSFKPFVYATAFEKGYTPDTTVFDLQTQFSTACSPQDVANDEPPCYSPSNYDGQFRGPIKLRNALAISENIPAVKTLYLAGIKDSIKTAQNLGITSLGDPSRYGLTLVLGGGEVSLLEMTGAYAVFANDGVKNPPTGILRVEDASGNILESYQPQPTRVLEPQIARLVNDVLSDESARAPEFGSHGVLYYEGANVADKTGTTNDSRDAWVIGYTPGISIGAWAGNNDNSPMVKKIAAFIVAPMWHDFMAYAIQKYPATTDFVPPAPETTQLPSVLTGNWNTDSSKGIHDILYWVQKENPRAGAPANPWSDPQFSYWDYPVQLWAANNGTPVTSSPTAPSAPTSTGGGFQITSPAAGTIVSSMRPIVMTAQDGSAKLVAVTYYVNGALAGRSTTAPFSVSVLPQSFGPAQIRAVGQLASGGFVEQTINVTVTIQ